MFTSLHKPLVDANYYSSCGVFIVFCFILKNFTSQWLRCKLRAPAPSPPPAKPRTSQQESSLVSQREASILKWPNMACLTAKEAPDGCNIQSNSSFICHMWWTSNAFIIILLDWEKHH